MRIYEAGWEGYVTDRLSSFHYGYDNKAMLHLLCCYSELLRWQQRWSLPLHCIAIRDRPTYTILLGLLQSTEYDWEHNYLSLSTRDYSALKSWSDGIQYGGQANAMQSSHAVQTHTAQRKNQPAKA